MRILRIIRNYFFYCGIEKDEYNAIKKDAYVSNFEVWRILHFLMAVVFGVLYICSLHYELMKANRWLYMLAFIYCSLLYSEKRLNNCTITDLFDDVPAVFIRLCPFP